MEGLETFCKTDLMDDRYLKAAQYLLKAVPLYQEQSMSKESWKYIKKVLSNATSQKLIINIIMNAHKDYVKAVRSKSIKQERINYIEKQMVVYNEMMKRAFKEIKEEGTFVQVDTIEAEKSQLKNNEANLENKEF